MTEVKCDNHYCNPKSGVVFVGNVDEHGTVICQSDLVVDGNHNCRADDGEIGLLYGIMSDKRTGTDHLNGLNLKKYFEYFDELNFGMLAAKTRKFQEARGHAIEAEKLGRDLQIDHWQVQGSIWYMINSEMPEGQRGGFCYDYCRQTPRKQWWSRGIARFLGDPIQCICLK